MNTLSKQYLYFLDFFFPSLCLDCRDRLINQEKYLCFECWNDLPITNFHFNKENKVAQLFWGRVSLENATAFLAFNKGSKAQKIIHAAKYNGLKELGYETGRRFGYSLNESPDYIKTDIVVPVPLHPKKQKQRGYNQSEWIAKGIAKAMNKQISINNLYRKIHTSTQTKKNRYERWENVENIFDLNHPYEFIGKNLLLVDDVVTTGATLESCALQLLKIDGVKISIATLAFADY